MGKLKIYIGLLALLFGIIIALDGNQPKEIDWSPTYSVNDKIPLGLYVFDKELANFVKDTVEKLRVTPYEFFDAKYDHDAKAYTIAGNFLNISNSDNIDAKSLEEIFYFVSHGNSAFLSMQDFGKIFADSLNVKVSPGFRMTDSIRFGLANPKFGKKKYVMVEGVNALYFSSIDTANTTVLGYMDADSLRANFVKVNYRAGSFYLHTVPAAFTNFHLLKGDHHEYAESILSYMPDGKLYWFARQPADDAISNSQLRYIFSQPSLKWAWLLFVFGMLAFMVFNARRKQRVVPILEPLPNTTVDFAKTIGNLYYQEGDHHAVIDRKIIYFLEKIRTDHLLDTSTLDDAFARKLQQKTGKPMADIEEALSLVRAHRNSPHTAIEADLIKINSALEKIIH